MIISRPVLLRIRNVSDKNCRGTETHFMFNYIFSENRAVYDRKRKNMVQPDRSHTTMWHMCTARWVTNDVNIDSEYVKLIAFALQ
jgi:hypothetical protein